MKSSQVSIFILNTLYVYVDSKNTLMVFCIAKQNQDAKFASSSLLHPSCIFLKKKAAF